MSATETPRRPVPISEVMRRAVTSSQVKGTIGAAMVMITTVNDALEQLENAEDEHAGVRDELVAALTLALASVPDIEAKGITLGGLPGQERLTLDTEALSTALWNDPQALRGLSEGLSAALAGDVDDDTRGDGIPAAPAAEPPSLGPDGFHGMRIMAQMQGLKSAPSTSRHRLELLV